MRACLILSLILVRMHVRLVPDVTDVPVSFVDNEFCDGFWCCSDWEFGGTPVLFLSPKMVLIIVQIRRKR